MSSMMRLVTTACHITDPVNGRAPIPAGTPVVMPQYAAVHAACQCRDAGLPQPRISRMGYYERPYCGQDLNRMSLLAWRGAGIGDQLIVAGCLEQLGRLYPTARLGLMCDPNVAAALYAGAEHLPFEVVQEPVTLAEWQRWDYHWIVEGYCDGNYEPDQPDVWDGHLAAIGILDRVPPSRRRVFVPESRQWTERARAFLDGVLQMASGGRGTWEAPRTPRSMQAAPDTAEYSRIGAARVGQASTPLRTATAGNDGVAALTAEPAAGMPAVASSSGESEGPRSLGGVRGRAPIILWQLAASTPMRSLAPAHAAECLRALVTALPEAVVILTGHDREFGQYAGACDVAGIAATTRGLCLQEVCALVGMADVVVCPDSCLGHVAAAQSVPCVCTWCPFPARSRATYYDRHVNLQPETLPACAPCWAHEYGPINHQRGCPLTETDPSAVKWCKGLAAIRPEAIVEAVRKEID